MEKFWIERKLVPGNGAPFDKLIERNFAKKWGDAFEGLALELNKKIN